MARTKRRRAVEDAAKAADLACSAARIAWLAGVSQAAVSDAVATTDIPRAKGGTMSWPEVRAWAQRNRRLGYGHAGSAPVGGTDDHRGQLDRYKALTAKREYEQAMGQLVPRSDIEREVRQYVLAVRAALLALPQQIAAAVADLPARQAEAVLRERLTRVCQQHQEGLVAIPPELGAAIDRLLIEHSGEAPRPAAQARPRRAGRKAPPATTPKPAPR